MSILKMEAVTLAGRLDDFERVVSKYVISREIHLENAIAALNTNKGLFPYNEDNQYSLIAKSLSEILKISNFVPKDEIVERADISKDEMYQLINEINNKINDSKTKVIEYEKKIVENNLILKQLETMLDFDIDLPKLFNFEFLNFRFGRMPKAAYKTLITYLDELEVIFIQTYEDNSDIWGFYFMPTALKARVDAVFASLYFERIVLPSKIAGTPKYSSEVLKEENQKLNIMIQKEQEAIQNEVKDHYIQLSDSLFVARKYEQFSEVRRKSAHTKEFFYIVGWMSKKDTKELSKEVDGDDSVMLILEDPSQVSLITTPTKLKNNRLFRPFEFFVKMYGLPSYGEIDPTPILAITYILLFGIMFGDVGQSALFAIGGFIVYKLKKIDLAAIVSMVGVSGIVFGFIYGSVFGNETLLEHVRLINPMEKISFILVSSVVIGICLILSCMVINMINAIKSKQWGKLLFNQNGLSGLLFYGVLISVVGMIFLSGGVQVGIEVIIAILAVTFILMYMQEPLSKLIKKKKDWLPKDGMFFVETFFEMFDVLLSFITNTISFLRVGAFAIIHVGMMMVVSVLAEKMGAGGNLLVRVIGNIIVMGLEGLIVGIQVLRLEYYEMFSRYFEGDGKEFTKIKKKSEFKSKGK